MKLNLNRELTHKGEPIKGASSGKPVTLRNLVLELLDGALPTPDMPEGQQRTRYKLARRIEGTDGEAVELSHAEIADVQAILGRQCKALIVGVADEMLQESVPSKGNGKK